jgi:phage tail-like protein
MPITQPTTAVQFRLTLAEREIAGVFRECTGLDSETEVIEQRSVDETGQQVVRRVPEETKWSNITLKRGIDTSLDLWNWRDTVMREGVDRARSDGTIELLDYDGNPIAAYRFRQGWPVRYSGAVLGAAGDETAFEAVEICHEGLERLGR